MKNIYLLLVLTLLVFPQRIEGKQFLLSNSDSLKISDSTIAKNYMIMGDSLFNAAQHDSAIVCFDKAAVIFERRGNWEDYVYCLSRKGRSIYRNGDFESAIKIYKNTKIIIMEKLDDKDISMLRILQYLGAVYGTLGDYNLERGYAEDAINLGQYLEKDLEASKILSSIYNSLCAANFEDGKYDLALNNVKQALDIIEEYRDELPSHVGNIYNSLANVYYETGYYNDALINYELALKFYSKGISENHLFVALNYHNMAILMSERKGDNDEALIYVEKALSVFQEIYGEAHYHVAMAYYNKGKFYFKKRSLKEAMLFYNKALSSYKSVFKAEEHTDVAMTYNSIGEVYESLSNYDTAFEYYKKAVSIRIKIFGERHPDVAESYNNMGSIKRIQKKYEESIKYHEDALTILKQTYGNYHFKIAECYNLLGLVYMETKKLDVSLQYFQKALMANVPSFSNSNPNSNPNLKGILSEPILLESLNYKAETLTFICQEEKKSITSLRMAFNTYETMADLIDKMRSGYNSEGSKLFLAEKSSEIFECAIKLSIKLFDITGETKYRNDAYFFNEKSRARILQEAINESHAKNFSGIPDGLLQKEKQLKIDLTFYENQLQEEKYRKENIDTLKVKDFESRLFSLNMEYQKLIKELEINYPKYYHSKYLNETIKIRDVQKSLETGSVLLEYFIGEETIYMFYISKNNFDIVTIDVDSRFDDLVKSFYSSIKKIEKKEYLNSANQLYELLIKPVEHFLTDKRKLIIIPDGELYYVPFEALITEVNTQSRNDFSKQNYLINRFDISYNYSSTFVINRNNKSLSANDGKGFIGFAPIFNGSPKAENIFRSQSIVSDSLNRINNNFRFLSNKKKVKELPYSEIELKNIIALFEKTKEPALGYFYEEASKETFMSEARNYQFVHLATHSFVNPDKPQFSGIMFSQQNDSANSNGIIYSNEIYNLDLNADLVVLSSCESGIGKLIKGEGMMALTRGFLYAGADNIITSLWKVLDKSTSELMEDFYKHALNGTSYSNALREAKLEMIKNKKSSFPLNWSGFVLIGQ